MTEDQAPNDIDRHNSKMAKKKQARDKIMATKTQEKGLVIVNTGKGKGKSSAAFGMIFRCIAHQMPCAVVQFIKGGMDTGERNLITAHFGDLCQFYTMGEGFTWETQDKERDIAARGADRGEGASEEQILEILAKMVKQRQEAAATYEEAGRLELAEQERSEILVIEEFLPTQLSDEEIEAAVNTAIAQTGADSLKDMGKVMGALKGEYAGQMDFGKAGGFVKQQLG